MSKIFINYDNDKKIREFYSYDPAFLNLAAQLNETEKNNLLENIYLGEILNVKEKNDNAAEITLKTPKGIQYIIINDMRIFDRTTKTYDDVVLLNLQKKISLFFQKKSASKNNKITQQEQDKQETFKSKKQTPKVNRNPKIKKFIITTTLLTTGMITFLSTCGGAIAKGEKTLDDKSTNNKKTEFSYNQTKEEKIVTTELTPIQEDVQEILARQDSDTVIETENDNAIEVSLEFDDLTDNGKLERVIEECGPYADEWIERYGLPKDLTYALICQESGALDFEVRDAACGPMQIQPSSYHNDNAIEYVKVPVYENGKLTGEYDEFYIADGRKLDDPRLEEKKYLVIQNPEDHFRIGCALLRRSIDKYKNIFIAYDSYNKGLYAFSSVTTEEELEYYKNNLADFSWLNKVPQKYGANYGDINYTQNYLRYLDTGTRGQVRIEYDWQGNTIIVDLTNENVYNNEYTLGG